MAASEIFLQLPHVPFCCGVRESFSGLDVPETLPFVLGMDMHTGMAIQLPNGDTERALANAYRYGSMLSTPLGEGTFGRERMQLMMQPLLDLLGDVTGKHCLEIGCGTGAPMRELIQRGAHLVGCEVGPQAQIAAQKTGARVVQQLFRADLFSPEFDCVYSCGVLEHIADITHFVGDALRVLKPGGVFYAVLQIAEPFLTTGNVSVLEHEHWNYFTAASAQRLLRLAGFVDVHARVIEACGELCFWGTAPDPSARQSMAPTASELAEMHHLLTTYGSHVQRGLERVRQFFAEAAHRARSVALYAGGAHYLMCAAPGQSLRFVDGDGVKHGKKWTKLASAIEAPSALVAQPVDYVVVCSPTYYPSIKKYLVDALHLPAATQIINMKDLL